MQRGRFAPDPGENNTAAKLLSRPGEAIYNDANGAPEGNHFFQVVWLSDEQREDYLKQIRAWPTSASRSLSRTPIVFEGDAPADLARNPLLRQLLDAAAWPESPRSAQAWLGDAVAIKDPTSALFRRQGGNHLLIVGQNDEAALGVTAAAIVEPGRPVPARRFRHRPRQGRKFFVLDGTPEDQPRARASWPGWPQPCRTASRSAAGAMPRRVPRRGGRRGRRAASSPTPATAPSSSSSFTTCPRFRDLRRREDDFGFSRKEDERHAPPTTST